MVEILIPALHRSDKGHPFAPLASQPELRRKVEVGLIRALQTAYRQDVAAIGKDYADRINTEGERRRRFAILVHWYEMLTGDCRYSPQHAVDELPRALRAELDGTPYAPPPANRLWTPASGG
jgi:hypothetical protein